jgi:hypothetical protein
LHLTETGCRGWKVSTLVYHAEDPDFESRPKIGYPDRGFSYIFSVTPRKRWDTALGMPRTLQSTSFPIHHSSTVCRYITYTVKMHHSITKEPINRLRETDCEDVKWIELA